MLGRTGRYDVIAEGEGYTYFKLEDDWWDSLVEEALQDFDEIWKVNKQFLDEQIALDKEILLTNNPYAAYYFPDGKPQFFQRELDYLRELGYIFEEICEGIWKALKK